MAEFFSPSGDSSNVAVPPPDLPSMFVPGMDNPNMDDGLGIVIPWGSGGTVRKYADYGPSVAGTQNDTLLRGLSLGELGTRATYNFEGLLGPQGIPGPAGKDGITTIVGWGSGNSNFLTALPENLDQINDLGTAADKLLYTSSYTGYLTFSWANRTPTGSGAKYWDAVASDDDGSFLVVGETYIYTSADSGANWTERQPAGAVSKIWVALDSDADGSNLIAGVKGGRLYTSINSGVDWTERQPIGDADTQWISAASDADGSHLIVCEIGAGGGGGRIYTSSTAGVDWTERRPIDDNDYDWKNVASSNDGTVLVATLNGNGDVYISTDSGANWTARQPGGASKSWHGLAVDEDGSNIIVAAYQGRVYTSADSGANWTERQPAGNANKDWKMVASNSDGSHLVAGGYSTKLWVSGDSGVTWIQQRPTAWTGIYTWWAADLDSDGSHLIIAQNNGLLYTGILATNYNVATWAETDITSAARGLLDDTTQAAQQTTLGLGTEDSPEFTGLTLSELTASQFVMTDASKALASLTVPLTVPYGGTGLDTITNHGLLLGSGEGNITPLAEASHGQLPIGSTGADPVLATLTGTANQINVTNAAGSITLSTNQDIHIDATPEFAGITIKNAADTIIFYVNDDELYFTAATGEPVAGNPYGLLLLFTYST